MTLKEQLSDDTKSALRAKDRERLAVLETQYRDAGRDELADAEAAEVVVLETYLPDALSDQELADLVAAAVTQSGAQSMQDMGKVMGILKPQVQGRADMGAVSAAVKSRLS